MYHEDTINSLSQRRRFLNRSHQRSRAALVRSVVVHRNWPQTRLGPQMTDIAAFAFVFGSFCGQPFIRVSFAWSGTLLYVGQSGFLLQGFIWIWMELPYSPISSKNVTVTKRCKPSVCFMWTSNTSKRSVLCKVRIVLTALERALNKSIRAESHPKVHSREYLAVTAALSLNL